MGDKIFSAICNTGSHIGHLQRRHQQFPLPYGKRDYGKGAPAMLAIIPVIVRGRGNKAPELIGEIRIQFSAESEGYYIVAPVVVRIGSRGILLIFEDTAQRIAIITVAGILNALKQFQG